MRSSLPAWLLPGLAALLFSGIYCSPASAACITITSPATNATVSGTIAVITTDTCSRNWFERLYVDNVAKGDFITGKVVFDTSTVTPGLHSLSVSSQSENPNSVTLGAATIAVNVTNCLSITAPAPGATVSGSNVAITTNDTCSGNWFESLYIDAAYIGDFATGKIVFNASAVSPGMHIIKVTSQSENPNITVLGTASESVNVQASTPYFGTLPPGATLPDDLQCQAQIAPTAETIPSNAPFNVPPTAAQLASLAADGYNYGPIDNMTWYKRVDGSYIGSTMNILQWAACKYGIDQNLVFGQAWQESRWQQGAAGDQQSSSSQCIQTVAHPGTALNPPFSALWNTTITEPGGATVSCPNCCRQSWSIAQTKVFYDWMTWPEIMQSTPFAAEYRYAETRTCMEGGFTTYFSWHPANSYAADQAAAASNPNGASVHDASKTNLVWLVRGCIGSHYSGGWYDSGALSYLADIDGNIANQRWLTPTVHVTGP